MSYREEILVICGPMWAGKSGTALILIDKLKHANIPYLVFRPNIDRYKDSLGSRYMQMKIPAISIDAKNPKEIYNHIDLNNLKLPLTIVMDEAQFYSDDLFDVVQDLHSRGVRFIIAGLEIDENLKPFGVMPKILAIASKVVKLRAVCVNCADDAWRLALKVDAPEPKVKNLKVGDTDLKLGGDETFAPMCSACYFENLSKLQEKNKK
ncbi:thymidine kinase [Candidatus Mycoplasma haematohominis]|uniref:Thymidine kinase n=1 Tax=Candidatus Mycoplasma haematohominis TaxID=1494318 RepID=A0A478FP94_9MOLU|nr:thymidine kinase [Candidatus Mycoplasma haemohominis]GCE63178.1 thymidine kinase [Candidatus Mycoplasma haemohominis]